MTQLAVDLHFATILHWPVDLHQLAMAFQPECVLVNDLPQLSDSA
jgi:hypothetical protein